VNHDLAVHGPTDRVTREQTTPVALDPAGFDRAAWRDEVNQQIVAFMLR
jgi:hydroxyethylthiazole kinase-like sugar kinase family protein